MRIPFTLSSSRRVRAVALTAVCAVVASGIDEPQQASLEQRRDTVGRFKPAASTTRRKLTRSSG